MAAGNPKSRKIEPHPLVQALNPDPAQPPRPTVKLIGLPGASSRPDHTRLWLDAELTRYVDVPDEAILHSKTLPDDAGTVLWVAADAKLEYGSVSSQTTQAEFLSGSIAATHLAGAAAAGAAGMAGGPMVTSPLSGIVPCGTQFPSLPFCPSEAMTPTHCVPCATRELVYCGLSYLHVCGFSYAWPCPTMATACPEITVCPPQSQPVLCQVSHIGPCASQTVRCAPSLHAICPTPTATPSVLRICPPPLHQSSTIPCPTGPGCPIPGDIAQEAERIRRWGG